MVWVCVSESTMLSLLYCNIHMVRAVLRYYVLYYNTRVQCIRWAGIQYSYVCPSVGGALYILHCTAAHTIVNVIITITSVPSLHLSFHVSFTFLSTFSYLKVQLSYGIGKILEPWITDEANASCKLLKHSSILLGDWRMSLELSLMNLELEFWISENVSPH